MHRDLLPHDGAIDRGLLAHREVIVEVVCGSVGWVGSWHDVCRHESVCVSARGVAKGRLYTGYLVRKETMVTNVTLRHIFSMFCSFKQPALSGPQLSVEFLR